MDASELRLRVGANIDRGLLPATPPRVMYAGYGRGDRCHGCDEPIAADQVEYELRYDGDRAYRLHLRCTEVWEAECNRRGDCCSHPASAG
jgi:hypothetical protein